MQKRALVFLLLVLLGCTQTTTTNPQNQPIDFRTGSEGISMMFVPNLPPPQLFDRDPFSVLMQVENKGTSKVGTGLDRVYLSGFDHNIITGIGTDGVAIPPLDGRGPYLPRGGFDTLSWKGTIVSLTDKRVDKYQPQILATACYNYETDASAQMCIDPNPFSPTSVQKVCTPASVSPGTEGAPIAVTTVTNEPAPGRTRFTITISNVGGGTVFKRGPQYMTKCSPYNAGLGFDEVDNVQVADVTLSGVSIRESCKPLDGDQNLRLTNGQGQIYCEATELQGQSPYLTPLNVVLRYGYRQSIATQVTIRPIS